MMPGVCLRVGLVLGATWLAYPQLSRVAERFPPWLIGGFLLGALVVLIRPRAIFAVLPILAAIAFLQFLGWLFRPLPDARRAGRNKAKSRRAD
jgi:hypothetical protein